MFLTTMTADAASQHGHEFSNNRATSLFPIATFPRSTLNALLAVATRQSTPPPPPAAADDDDGTNKDAAGSSQQNGKDASPVDSAKATSPALPVRPASSMSNDSANETRSVKSKRRPRPKTTYNLCHPPPVARQKSKLQLRPRVLLQLQQVTQSSRPRPAFEVVPSLRCAPKYLSKFGRVFRAVDRLGPDDLVVLKAAEYGRMSGIESSDEDAYDAREAIGAICSVTRKEDKQYLSTEICMDDGTVWHASPTPNGAYEFTTTDEHGLQLKARWVARSANRRKTSSVDVRSVKSGMGGGFGEERKFTFSTIRPDSRRHPIIASMTRSNIELMDEYTMPAFADKSVSNFSPINTPIATPSASSESESYMEPRKPESVPIKTDEALRKLILVTGIWVAFRENWSTAFKYTHSFPLPGETLRPVVPQRAVSMPPVDLKLMSRSTTPDFESRRNMPKMLLRSGSNKIKRTSASSLFSSTTPSSPTSLSDLPRPRARRSNSTDTADLRGSSTRWHRLQTEAFNRDFSMMESPREMDSPVDKDLPVLGGQSPNKSNSSPEMDATSEFSRNGASYSSPSPSHVRESPKADRGYVQSAYIPRESTKGLWDSGDAGPVPNTKKSRKKIRPKSYHDISDANSEKRKTGRFRKLLSLFRRPH